MSYDITQEEVHQGKRFLPGKNPTYANRQAIPMRIVGRNDALTSTPQNMWLLGSTQEARPFPSIGFTLAASSDNVADTAAGTGARTIEIDALTAAYAPVTITLTLNGQSKVTDTAYVGQIIRVNMVRVVTCGIAPGYSNVGNIYVYDSSDTLTGGVPATAAKIFGYIQATRGISHQAMFTVPVGYALRVLSFRCETSDIVSANAKPQYFRSLSSPSPVTATQALFWYFPLGHTSSTGSSPRQTPRTIGVVDEKCELLIQGSAEASSGAFVELDCLLVPKLT